MQVRYVRSDVIMHFAHSVIVAQGDFHTFVADVSYVLHQSTAVTYVRRSVHIQQRVLRIATEIIDSTG